MKIKKYLSPSGSLPKANLFQRPDGSYFYSDDGKTEISVTPLNKLTNNPAQWSYIDDTGKIYNPKREYKNTYTLTESNPVADYHNYLNLKNKNDRDKIMAKAYLENGNLYDAFMSYMGMKTPKNPFVITGEPSILPGRGINPKTTQNITKGIRTLEDYLRTTKVSAPKLEGTGYLRDNYATDRFLGGQIFESSLPEEAMRVQGHGMAKSPTILDALARLRYILDNGFEKGKIFYTAPLKANKETLRIGSILGTGGGKPYFDGHFLITGKPGLMINSVDDISTIYVNDAYQNEEALKAALKLQQYLQKTYPKINFKLYSLGYKQGGKMNTLQFLKNGSGIHIKSENKGKFTKYCHGKVTSECIARGKRSSDPAVRKRATFAANARKWKHKNGGKAFVKGVNVLDSNPSAYKYVKKKYKMHLRGGNLVINYIKAIENPNRVGWNGKVWQAPNLKGYDINLRGYGIDINTNQSAKKLTNGRPGRWMTDAEASRLMNEHINYITTAANKHIKGFNKLSPQRQAALLGMLYRGDSVNKSGINYLTKDDKKFFTSIGNYYRSKGLNERANNSDKFFKRYLLQGGSIDWNSIANVGLNLLLSVSKNKQISKGAEAAKATNKLTSKDFFDIYNLKLQEAKQLEEQLAKAVEAMTGTTINSSNIVTANNAWKNASGEYAALKNNVDLQNRAIDAQAQALKSDILGNAISGVMLLGMGMLNNYLNNKSSKTPNISFNKKVDFGNIKTDVGLLGTYSINSGYLPKQLSFDWSKVGNIK